MNLITIRKLCGRKWMWLYGMKFPTYRLEEEFLLPLSELIRSQWVRKMDRLNRLLTKGRRLRGDVLAV